MATAGFTRKTLKKRSGKNYPPELIYEFKDFLPGEVAVALPLTFDKLKLKYTQIPSSTEGPFSLKLTIPFTTHQVTMPGDSSPTFIPWGRYDVPKMGEIEIIQPSYEPHQAKLVCYQDDEKDEETNKELWDEIITTLREILPTITLFKGRAFQVKETKDLIVPRYIDLSKELTFFANDDVMEDLDLNIFSVLRNREALKEDGVRLKRGIALEGHYGTGKTLISYLTAKEAVANGWSYIMCSASLALKGYMIALSKQPAVLFIEDLDAAAHGNRDHLNNLLNTLSGVETKGPIELMLLVSTNFISRIDPAFLRPERIGSIIKLDLPNVETISTILKSHLDGHMEVHGEEEFDDLCTSLIGATPAIVGEVAERAKIFKRARIKETGKPHKVDIASLKRFVSQMARQRELSNPIFKGKSKGEELLDAVAYAAQQHYSAGD